MRILSCAIAGAGDIGPTRRALGRALNDRRFDRTQVDAAELVASELMTNAIIHGLPPMALQIGVSEDGSVTVTMYDHGAQRPARRDAIIATQPGGYGLRLVEANVSSWGCREVNGAKEVWAVVPAASGPEHRIA
jgi:anti-sigma regulatory factor (Ser/Thr protein kinase)